MPDFAVRTEELTMEFPAVRALDNLSIEIPEGIVFGFLGPNGAGKTTTIRLLLGLLDFSHGSANVLGHDLKTNASEVREKTGALLEHTGLYERLSAKDNLDFYGRVYLMPSHERHDRIKQLLTHFDLWDRRDDRVGTWSRGMKQKLAVARAILHKPSLVFLDEPTAGLDPIAATALRDDLAGLAENEGMTVFLTTHNLAEAERLCNLTGVINKGKLLYIGRPDEFRSNSGVLKAEIFGRGFSKKVIDIITVRPEVAAVETVGGRLIIELKEPTSIAPIVSLMVREGVEIEEIRKGKATLEEAFLTLIKEEQ